MHPNHSKFLLALATFCLVFLVFTPYFTTGYLDLRQEQENEENQKRLLEEEEARKQAVKDAEDKIYLMGKFDPAKRKDFIQVPAEYSLSPYPIYLRKEAYTAYLKMQNAAAYDGISLKISSATRNFDYQKWLWNNKWTGVTYVEGKKLSDSIPNEQERFDKILEYSAAPGTSRHHWGTEIDINAAIPSYFEKEKGMAEYAWLARNARLFGFCQTYNSKDAGRPAGYNEEKWHWSYLPLAKDFTARYENLITDQDIKGFLGDEYALNLNIIKNYVLGINPECM